MTTTCQLNKVYLLIISVNITNYNLEILPWYYLPADTLHIAAESLG
jgi:hypothetical protein